MTKELFRLYSAAHLVLIQDNKVLLAQRSNTGYQDGSYALPAGKLDGGETATRTVAREAQEEIGIVIQNEDLHMLHVMHLLDGRESVGFFLTTEHWEGDIRNMEPHKCSDLGWFPLDVLPENTIPYIRHALECIQKGETYSEFGWEK